MSSRRTVLIPAVGLGSTRTTRLLELIVEAAGPPGVRAPDTRALHAQGLGSAFVRARRAIGDLVIPSAIALHRWRQLAYPSPTLYLANPASNLSSARSADLGIALGLLMYFGHCRATRILATGHLGDGGERAHPPNLSTLARHLSAALRLGPQKERLPFLVLLDGSELAPDITASLPRLVKTLRRANIDVCHVRSLVAAVHACTAFKAS